LFIDGHSLAFRAFHAVPVEAMVTSTGQPVNAVFGFTSMLLALLDQHKPQGAAVAFDVARVTFRNEEYPEYKANRGETPEEFIGQVDLIKRVLDALGVQHRGLDGFEADDILATWTAQARDAGHHVLIASGDRDTLQHIDEQVSVLYPERGMREARTMTPQAVEDKYGVTPRQYPDLAALVGETSDNLPGVPGVGPKTAAKWLAQYQDLETILAHQDDIPGKVGQALRDHVDQVRLNRRLATPVTTLDLGLALEDMRLDRCDADALHEIFDLLEFRNLRARALALFNPAHDDGPHLEPRVLTLAPGQLGTWLEAHKGQTLGLDVEGWAERGMVKASGIGIGAEDGEGIVLDLTSLERTDLNALTAWLTNPNIPKACANAKSAQRMLQGANLPLGGVTFDVGLAAYLCYPDQRAYGVADLYQRLCGRKLPEVKDQGTLFDLAAGPSQSLAIQAGAIPAIVRILEKELGERGATTLLREVEMPLTPVLGAMEEGGIAVDVQALANLEGELAARVTQARAQAVEAAGEEVNLSSPQQLQKTLFTTLGFQPKRRIKTGYSTDAETLAELFAETNHPFLRHLLEHRDAIKMQQMVAGLGKAVGEDGRIHATFHQSVAATGRLSSSDPNLQNIPVRTEVGRQIRATFVAGEGYEALMTADYSQVEMRIMAHLSGDESLIAAFVSGEDLHRAVAGRVFGVAPDQVTAEQRSRIKAMSYGLAYGLSAHGLAKQLGVGTGEARALMDDYFGRFAGIRDYLAGVVESARRTGYTETIMGRRRYLPELVSDNRQVREMAERAALNAPIQGSAADIVKVAMLGVDRELRARGLRSRMLLQVHDELVLEIWPGEAQSVEALVRAEMEGAVTLSVPLDVSVGVGPSWDAAAH